MAAARPRTVSVPRTAAASSATFGDLARIRIQAAVHASIRVPIVGMVQRVVGLSAKLQTVPLANREQLVQRQIYIHLARAERGIVAYVAERRELRPAEGPADLRR